MLKFKATGTIEELCQLYSWDRLCDMIGVDYYKRGMVLDSQVFTITEQNLLEAGIIRTDDDV